MWRETAITRCFGLELPIVQGPMGNGYSPPALAASVSATGALGSLGAFGRTPDELRTWIRAVRAQTDRPFAVNLWVPRDDERGAPPDAAQWARGLAQTEPYRKELGLAAPPRPTASPVQFEAQVEVLLDERPPIFSFIFGVPSDDVLAACRARGIKLLGTATNVAEARVLEAAGVDAICASGAEAGGHRGLFRGAPADALIGTVALVPQVCDAVKLPVIAAGGIADGRGIAAAFALGAGAVQIGTAFIAASESGASETHRAALADEGAEHTVVTRVFSGRYGRGLSNRLVEELEAAPDAVLPFPYQGSLLLPIRAAAGAAGRVDIQPLWAGQAARLARREPAAALVRRLVEDTERVLGRLRG